MTVKKDVCVGKIITALLLLIGMPALASCSMYQEGKLTPNRLQVEESRFSQTTSVDQLDEEALAGLARHYADHGSGPLDIMVTYDPRSSVSTAMAAGNEVSRIASTLRKFGAGDVNVRIVPILEQGDDSQAIITFMAYDALAPKDCSVMEGFEKSEVIVDSEYKLGCAVDTVFARQIARPKDLNGQAFSGDTTEGRSASNIVELQRSGTQNEPLEGETASE